MKTSTFNTRGMAMVLLACMTAPVNAKVPEEEAARLGVDLTPFGGEVAGNADGSIPKWEPKWRGVPPGLEYGGPGAKRPNPYADEKPILVIDAQNYKEHADNLSKGQQGMFEKYPEFRIQVYPTHRDFALNERQVARVRYNAANTELDNGVETLKNWTGGPAFPIPQRAEEILWNMRTYPCVASSYRIFDSYAVYANGERSHEAREFYVTWPFNNHELPIPTTEETVGDRYTLVLYNTLAPPRTKGSLIAAQDPLDYGKYNRNAWSYDPGTRRVRKAPNVGYDNPQGPGGMYTTDDVFGFNGALDRFTYTLQGKQEIYVPYHNFDFNNPEIGTLDDRLTKHHLNPDYVRFEKRRVWVVEANLAEGKRHAYSKRRWYIDEENWMVLLSENYDSRSNLWRAAFFLSDYEYQDQCYSIHVQVYMDLPSGAYVASGVSFDRKETDYSVPFRDKSFYTPTNLRKMARK